MEREEVEIRHVPESSRFEAESGEAVLVYHFVSDRVVDFGRTFVPPARRRRGVAAQLVEAGLAWADREDLRILASCWYVSGYLERHPAWRRLLADGPS